LPVLELGSIGVAVVGVAGSTVVDVGEVLAGASTSDVSSSAGIKRASKEARFLGLGASGLSGSQERCESSGVVAVQAGCAARGIRGVVGTETRVGVERVVGVLLRAEVRRLDSLGTLGRAGRGDVVPVGSRLRVCAQGSQECGGGDVECFGGHCVVRLLWRMSGVED